MDGGGLLQEPQVRVDTVGVAFPIRDFDRQGCTVSITGYGTPEEMHRYRRTLPGGGFLATGVGGMAWVEASLPKRLSGENVEGLTLGQAEAQIRQMVREASRWVEPGEPAPITKASVRRHSGTKRRAGSLFATELTTELHRERDLAGMCSVEDPKVTRLDLVRDFQLKDTTVLGPVLDGLATVPRVGRVKVRRFADADRGQAQTLTVGPMAWKATLYDKDAETGGRAEGVLRFEARLHADQLRSEYASKNGGQVGTVADFEEAKLRRLARSWFGRAGFDREVMAMDVLWRKVLGSELSPRERATFVGWCDAVSRGMHGEVGLADKTERKYRNIAAELGVILEPAGDTTEVVSARIGLDYDAGHELLRVA